MVANVKPVTFGQLLAMIDPRLLVRPTITVALALIPSAIVLFSLLMAARHPQWCWAFTKFTPVYWIAGLAVGVVVVPLGLVLSALFWWRVQPVLNDAETGHFGPLN